MCRALNIGQHLSTITMHLNQALAASCQQQSDGSHETTLQETTMMRVDGWAVEHYQARA
jgi:hypothetical protein